MTFITVPTREFFRAAEIVARVNGKYRYYDISLECKESFSAIKSTYRWKKDTKNIVKTVVTTYTDTNKDECSDKNYKKPKPKWWKGNYKRKIRSDIKKAIKDCKNDQRTARRVQ